MKKYLIIISILFLVGICSGAPVGYNYYKALHIDGNASWAGDQTNYQMQYFVYRSSGTDTVYSYGSGGLIHKIYVGTSVQSDFDDIYFTDSSGNAIDYWREEGYSTSVASFWVEVPTISKTTGADIRMYYGNSTVSTSSNGTNTFVLFDTFDGSSLNATTWTASGTYSVSSSLLELGGGTGYTPDSVSSASTFNSGYGCGIGAHGSNIYYGGDYSTSGFGSVSSGLYGTYYIDSSENVYSKVSSSSTEIDDGFGEWNEIEYFYCWRGSSQTIFEFRDESYVTPTNIVVLSTSAGAAPITFYLDTTKNSNLNIEYIFVKNYIFTEPTPNSSSTVDLSVTAAFSADHTTIYQYQTVNFTDSSTGSPDAWEWDIDNSGSTDYTSQNPSHTYTTPGTYTVKLTATNSTNGNSDIETKTSYITVLCDVAVAQFSANVTNGAAPLVVGFTSSSTNATSFEWDFDSDGDVDSTDENPTYTYPSVGFWTVTLEVTGNGTCSDSEIKEDYIYVLTTGTSTENLTSGYGYQYPPKDVRFEVTSLFGNPISGATVTATGVSTTTGAWDWLLQIFGVALNETPIMNTTMTGTTDSNGQIVFLMIPSVKYNMSFVKSGEINQQMYITPKDEYYMIVSTTGGQSIYETGYNYNEQINITVSTSDYGSDDDYITITYVDLLAQTTSASILINQTGLSGETTVNSTVVAAPSGNFTESLLVEDTAGETYIVRVFTSHTTFGDIERDFSVGFMDDAKTFGLPSDILIYLSIFIIIFVAMFFGASSATQGSLIVCFVGWILYAIGWLSDLGLMAPTSLIFATVVSILAIIARRKNMED